MSLISIPETSNGVNRSYPIVAILKQPSTHQLVVLNRGTNTPWEWFKGAGGRWGEEENLVWVGVRVGHGFDWLKL